MVFARRQMLLPVHIVAHGDVQTGMLQDGGSHHGVLGCELGDEGCGRVAEHMRGYGITEMLLCDLGYARVDAMLRHLRLAGVQARPQRGAAL
jgi:hypothetical protein